MPKFITIEGPDGVGKSLTAKQLKKALEDEGYNCLLTTEPGGTEIGKKIKDIILQNEMDVLTETLLFFADRAEHYKKVLSSDEPDIIISDRYVDSTIVYQHKVKGQNIEDVKKLFEMSTGCFVPDLKFVFISDESHRDYEDPNDKHDSAGESFRDQLTEEYLQLASENSNKTQIIDTSAKKWECYVEKMKNSIIQLIKN